jgi:VanZ family protein
VTADRYRRRPVTATPHAAPRSTPSAAPGRRPALGRALDALAAVSLVLVVGFSLIPDDPSAEVAWDKLRHAVGYAAFTGVLLLALVWAPGRPPVPRPVRVGRTAVLGVAVVALGGVLEVLQAKAVDRDGSWGDLLADAVGVVVAVLVGAAVAVIVRHRTGRTAPPRVTGRSFESPAKRPQ